MAHGNVVYLACQVAADPVPSVAEQIKQILAKVYARLTEASSDKLRRLFTNMLRQEVEPRINPDMLATLNNLCTHDLYV